MINGYMVKINSKIKEKKQRRLTQVVQVTRRLDFAPIYLCSCQIVILYCSNFYHISSIIFKPHITSPVHHHNIIYGLEHLFHFPQINISVNLMSVNHQSDGEFNSGDSGCRRKEQKTAIGYGRKAKMVVLSKIKEAKKIFQRKKSKENESSGFCCLYIGRMNSSSESQTSDPNSAGFGFDSLRGLIEKSDFLLDDCNTHFDVYISDGNDFVCYDDDDDD